MNRLLQDAGYLERKDGESAGRRVFDRLGLDKARLRSLLQRTDIEDRLLQLLPNSLVDGLAATIPGDHALYDVAFDRTQAFAYSGRSVYINDEVRFEHGVVPPAARDGVKQAVRALLETAIHPDTGERLFEVHDGAELFPTDPQAPDLVVDGLPETEVKSSLAPELVTPVDDRAASHRRTGMCLAWGPNIASTELESATVYDILPTVLHSQSADIPRNVDGGVLDLFAPESEPADRPPSVANYRRGGREADPEADFDDLEDRLRGLGYLD